MSNSIDRALVERWHQGDERAASEIVARHSESVARFIASLGERDVDEAVQDTFVRAFRGIGSWRGDSSLRTWLLAVARRVVADRARSATRRRKREERWGQGWKEYGESAQHSGLDAVLGDEAQGAVAQALAGLSPVEREVFSLRVIEGLDYQAIAEVTGRQVAACRVAYSRALAHMKTALRGAGYADVMESGAKASLGQKAEQGVNIQVNDKMPEVS